MKKVALAAAMALSTGLVALLAYAQVVADGSHAPRLIPYVGHLDKDGEPVTGKVAMKVCLVAAPSTPCLPKAGTAWSADFNSVDVAGGQFSLVLGQNPDPIDESIFKTSAALHIRAMVGAYDAGGSPTFVQLSGAQQLLSVPFAVNADGARNMRVLGPVYNGNVRPNATALGLLEQTPGAGISIATNGGDIVFNRTATADNGFGVPPGPNLLTVGATGVKIGDKSPPIRQITKCLKNTSVPDYDVVVVGWVDGDCSNGLPAGQCYGMLTNTADCGPASSWEVLLPGEDPAKAPNGGMRWYNHSRCGAFNVGAVYLCGGT